MPAGPRSNDRSAECKPKKGAACVATSGPSQGRKRPRRAWTARGLLHRNKIAVRRTKSKPPCRIFFANRLGLLVLCFYSILKDMRIPGNNIVPKQEAGAASLSPIRPRRSVVARAGCDDRLPCSRDSICCLCGPRTLAFAAVRGVMVVEIFSEHRRLVARGTNRAWRSEPHCGNILAAII